MKANLNPRVIRTSHDYPPISTREYDWSATFDGYEPGEPVGRGESESAAVADLLLESDYMGPVTVLSWIAAEEYQRNEIAEHASMTIRRDR